MKNYNIIKSNNVPIYMWTNGVPLEPKVLEQLQNVASLPITYDHVALMPDGHVGKGATVGSVIATKDAIIPAAVGVDIGCGMNAVRLSLKAEDLPDSLRKIRNVIELMVPTGFNFHSSENLNHRLHKNTSKLIDNHYTQLQHGLKSILHKNPDIENMSKSVDDKVWQQIGTLGGGNHFIELCLDENNDVWIMLHSGSRGIGNCIGRYFIERAKEEMMNQDVKLPDKDLSYLTPITQNYFDYIEAVEWAQDYARRNRKVMMQLVLNALKTELPNFKLTKEAINCHHNYVTTEFHYGEEVYVTRKGAVRAQHGDLGIIPGSMGAKSYIVRGKGNAASFHSCSHGAGRVMSRTKAKKTFTVEDHEAATFGIECKKDKSVIDETPAAYKDIDAVMAAQTDLVEILHTLKQVLCVKG